MKSVLITDIPNDELPLPVKSTEKVLVDSRLFIPNHCAFIPECIRVACYSSKWPSPISAGLIV
jgi:hypothetical protein